MGDGAGHCLAILPASIKELILKLYHILVKIGR